MYYRAARERARAAEEQLNLLEPVSLRSIHSHLETANGRKIVIKPMDSTPTDKVCGLWFGLDSLDLIFHAPGASEVHRQQIILHEFAHMILRHEQAVVSHDYAKVFFPDLDPERVIIGINLAKLAVNTFMISGLWFLRTAVVNAISPEADKRAAWIRCTPVAVTLILQAAFFFLTGPMPSTATRGEYHRFLFAAPFSRMMVAFIGWSRGDIAWACWRCVPRMRQSFRIGFSMVGLGCVISVATMVLMALAILSSAFPQMTPLHAAVNAPFQMLEMFPIVLVGVGLTIPAVAGRAARRLASLRMLRTIAKVEPIRVKALKNADMAGLLKTDAAARPQERLHRMIVEIWDAGLAAGGSRSALTPGDRAYLLTVESDLDLERTS